MPKTTSRKRQPVTTKGRKTAPKGKMSDAARERAAQLARQGVTQRGIADRLRVEGLADVSQQAVGKLLRRLDGAKERPLRRRRSDHRSPDVDEAAVEVSPDGDELAALRTRLDELGAAPVEVLEAIRRQRLPAISQLAERALTAGNVSVARDAIKLEIDVAKQIVDATPPPPPDPEQDPANIAARDRVRERLARMSKAHRCGSCGAPSGEAP